MQGTYEITIENKKTRYMFTIRRNLTIIRGDSATGKTTLIDMVREYAENGENSGITLSCSCPCVVLEGANWRSVLPNYQNSIVFIDEGNNFITTKEFASEIAQTSNYYVIATRDALPMLPYSVEEIYGIRTSNKYASLKKVHNELYHMYNFSYTDSFKPAVVLTEDSASGHQFWKSICEDEDILCAACAGKSNVIASILSVDRTKPVLVIADGAAFGPEIDRVLKLSQVFKLSLYLPESFEWLILKAEIIRIDKLQAILANPSAYIESEKFFSWEQFFTAILTDATKDTPFAYKKAKINEAYLTNTAKSKILHVDEGIMEHILRK